MEEMTKKALTVLKTFIKANVLIVKVATIVTIAVSLGIIAFVAYQFTNEETTSNELQVEDTAAIIDRIKPSGKLVLYKSELEDYTIRTAKEGILFKKEHSIVCVLNCTCCYYIDLDSIKYDVQDSVVVVTMPKVKYECNRQKSKFIEDDADFWAKNIKKTAGMNAAVEKKIRHRFDTAENREKAELHAENVIYDMLTQMGLEVKFEKKLEQKKEVVKSVITNRYQ